MGNEELKEDKAASKPWWRSKSSIAVKCAFLTVSLLLVLYLAGKIFLSSSFAAGLVSDYLSGMLHQPVVVSGLTLSGTTLSFHGITVTNPEGFPSGALLDARSLSIAPDIMRILTGKRNLALLRVEGMKVDLQKNSAGEWNFSGLARILSREKKKPSAEFFISRLIIRDATLKIGNYSLEKLALTVKDFSAKGLADSKLVITGTDMKGNPFRIAAEGRLGKDPDIRLSLEAPRISTETFKFAFKGKSFLDLEKGVANLSLAAGYHSGVAVAKGRMGFDGLGLLLKGRKPALRGRLDFVGRYVVSRDEADLERIALVINDKIRFDASGTVRKVKSDKKFVGELSSNRIPLSEFRIFLPPETARNIAFDGTVECRNLRLAGNGVKGITSGKGKILIRNGKAVKGGQPLFKGLSSDVDITRVAGGWNLDGRLSMSARAGGVPLENVDARFNSRFSDRFSPLSLEIPVLKAALMGVPVHGTLNYSPKKREPYRGKLYVKNARLSTLNKLVSRKNMDFISGTADLTVWGSGQGLSSFAGKMDASIRALKGHISGKDCALKAGKMTSHFSRSGAGLIAKGRVSADGGIYSGRNFSGKFAWSLAGDKFKLTDGTFTFDRAGIRIAGISGRLPVRKAARGRVRYPLVFALSGMYLSVGETGIKDISGNVSAAFSPGSGAGALMGNASLVLPSVNYRKRRIGSIKIHTAMSGERAVAEMEGTALGGAFSSVVKFDPFSPTKGVSFKGKLGDAQLVDLSGVLPDRFKLKFPSGKFSADFDGRWSSNEGLQSGLDGSGTGLSVAVQGGKTVISGIGVVFRTDIAGAGITIKEATMSKGDAVAVKVSGKVADAVSPARKGTLSFDLASAPVNSLLDTFANILPRALQEADGGGGVGAHGSLQFAGGKVLLAGNANFDNAGLDIPSQKLSVSGLSGSMPFSIYLAGTGIEKPSTDAYFTRENYPSLLKSLSRKAKGLNLLKVDKVRFGAVETGGIRMKIKAEKGRIEVTSVESILYNGTVLGKGWFVYDRGPYYGLDLLINDMSLRRFCVSYPAVKGYISGLLDGIISIYGEKGGIPALIGYIDLWTHEGKGEEMLVSKEFLQKLAGRNLKGFFFRDDRPYDNGEISAYLMDGYVTFEKLDISHTNFFGMKDLNVSVAPVQNMIGLAHLFQTIREAASRGKPATGGAPQESPAQPDINWLQ
jgi:hypothetical protein